MHFMYAVKAYGRAYEDYRRGKLDVFSAQGPFFNSPVPKGILENYWSAQARKEPTRWPDVFHAKTYIKVPGPESDVSPVLHSFYDYPNLRMMSIIIPPLPGGAVSKLVKDSERHPENYSLSMKRTIKAFQQQDDKAGVVDTLDGKLFFPDTAIWALLEPYKIAIFSRSAPACEVRPAIKYIVPPPDVMSGASYLGTEVVDGVNCDVYAKGSGPPPFADQPLVVLFESTETGYPVKFALFNGVELVIKDFDPNGSLDDADWELPDSCEMENKTFGSSSAPLLSFLTYE